MSRFLSAAMKKMSPYIPGEQSVDKEYIKLNTNECPYSPSLLVNEVLANFCAQNLRLYPDPESGYIKQVAAEVYNTDKAQVFVAGGSDEALGFAFMAFFDKGDKAYFPNITYGFYKVYADLLGIQSCEIPLNEDFTINISDYCGLDGHIFIANPNAPTGICLSAEEIEKILSANPDRLVVIDEAYIDFAQGQSCVKLIDKYDNLLVVQTFSKSRALAGMRIGMAFGNAELISALERVKFSFNPYNIDRVSAEIAVYALKDKEYLEHITLRVAKTREKTAERLAKAGFEVIPSSANFIFAKPLFAGGKELYLKLKEKGVLVRHFDKDGIKDFLRITIGKDMEMDALFEKIAEIKNGI